MTRRDIAFLIIALCPMGTAVGANNYLPPQTENPELEILDARIDRLESERDRKFAALSKCERETKGFKIAGISTIAATGIGLYANIKLNEKLSKMGSGGGKTGINDLRSSQQKCEDEIELHCSPDTGDPDGKSCKNAMAGEC